jgi:hypothetical protein
MACLAGRGCEHPIKKSGKRINAPAMHLSFNPPISKLLEQRTYAPLPAHIAAHI